MNYWMIRVDAPSVQVNDAKEQVTIAAKRLPGILAGDTVVLLTYKNDGSFYKYGRIGSIESVPPTGLDGRWMTVLQIEHSKLIEPAHGLNMLRYSLTFVTNTNNPGRHFRRPYRRLPSVDFSAIKSGEPFVARTAYFELRRALPATLLTRFDAELLIEVSGPMSPLRFERMLEQLIRFIRRRVLFVGELLEKIEDALRKLSLIEDERGKQIEHYLVDESSLGNRESGYDSLLSQARYFRNLRHTLETRLDGSIPHYAGTVDVLSDILEELKDTDRAASESRYENIFGTRV